MFVAYRSILTAPHEVLAHDVETILSRAFAPARPAES